MGIGFGGVLMANNPFAVLFPGQGSQSVGMLAELRTQFPGVRHIFSRASEILRYDVWELIQNGPAEKLDQTEFTQPALLVADVAVWECKKNHFAEQPLYLAGHSLGEYAALVCADALAFEDAVSLVALRGKYMQEAVAPDEGAMAVIVGLSDETVRAICDEVRDVSPANYNSIGQVVIAGKTDAIEKAIQLSLEKGAKIAKKIPVSVPSHCALMQSAALKLAQKLRAVDIRRAKIPVVQNADVAIFKTPDTIRDALIRQLTSPVRWVETIQWMIQKNIQLFYECGPGKILAGLNKRISKDVITENLA